MLARSGFAAFALAALLSGCQRGEQAPGAGAPGGQPAMMALPATVIDVEPKRVPIHFEVIGQTEGSKQVEVRARVSGILEKRLYTEGAPVRAGEPMFRIERAPFEIALAQAKAQLAQAQARVDQARREADRLKPLAQEKAVSRKEYDDTVSNLEFAEASQKEATARVRDAELNLSYTLVAAPVAGVSGRSLRSEGSLLTTDATGGLLTTIDQVNPIWVRFSLAESDLDRLPGHRLTEANVTDVRLVLPDGSVYPEKGRLNFVATAIDPTLGTQQLRAEFPNPRNSVLPGEFVRVQLTAGHLDHVFLVPQSAVLQTEKGFLLFVLDAGNKATPRPVQVGHWVGSDWVILKGLKAGDRVIVDNLMKLRPGTPIHPLAPGASPAAGPAPAAPAK